jgi:hypothetical protein
MGDTLIEKIDHRRFAVQIAISQFHLFLLQPTHEVVKLLLEQRIQSEF